MTPNPATYGQSVTFTAVVAGPGLLSGTVTFYDGATLLYSLNAGMTRGDVGGVLGDNGAHGFSISTPPVLKDGKPHTITSLPGNSTTALPGAAKSLTCP